MFAMVRAHWIDVGGMSTGFGAGPSVARSLAGRPAARPAQDLRSRASSNETLYRVHQGQHPLSRILARRHELADGGLPARRTPHGRAVRQIRQATRSSTPSRRSSTRPNRSAATSCEQLPDGVYEAERFLDDDGVQARRAACRSTPRSRSSTAAMTIDLSGCSGERKAGINSRTLAGARVAYKALTGPLDPVNEGSFRALDVIIPEGNIMMARFPAPMAGWSAIVPTVVDTHRRGAGAGHARPRARRPSRPPRRRGRVLRRASRRPDGASSCRASKAAAGAAGRSKTANPAPFRSARATCATAPSRASS